MPSLADEILVAVAAYYYTRNTHKAIRARISVTVCIYVIIDYSRL